MPEEGDLELVAARARGSVAEDEGDVAREDDERGEDRDPTGGEHEDRRSPDHEPVGERVGDGAEPRLHVPAPREVAVELVGERSCGEEHPCPPRRPVTRLQVEPDEDRDRDEARDRERVRDRAANLRPGHGEEPMSCARAEVAAGSSLPLSDRLSRGRLSRASVARVAGTLRMPGFVNAHSHTFQRSLRGRAAGGDFWAWRDVMLAEAERQTPELVRDDYRLGYEEMLAAGYTAVGEFHYLGFVEALAAAEAAAAAGIELVLLHVAYARGGLPRFRQESVAEFIEQVEGLRDAGLRIGVAPHSVRACPADWLEEIGRYAREHELPLHVHADEQPKEIEECLAEHGCRPIELLARTGCLTERTTVVHATHAEGVELDLLASSGAVVCACPTTEADLGDGFLPGRAHPQRERFPSASDRTRTCASTRSRSCASSKASPGARRVAAGCSRPTSCTRSAVTSARARSVWSTWPEIAIDLGHRSLRDVEAEHVPAALVAGCGSDVVVRG